MKIGYSVFLVLVLAIASFSTALADTGYTVQPGDTLYRIAARFGVSVQAIVQANQLRNPHLIYAGQRLIIPSAGSATATPPWAGQYVVQRGDTLWRLGRRFGTTVEALKAANKLTSNLIYPGQMLMIPGAAVQPPPNISHFSVSPAAIWPGQPVTLTWQASAQQVTLQRIDLFGRLGEFYSVGPSGSMQLSTLAEQRGQVEFMLFAATGGVSVQATARAQILCPDTWFFASPPPECPASPPHATTMQVQDFERGRMLWTQVGDRVYVLYADGGQPRWDTFANAWFAGQPESDPTLSPPPGFYQPVHGFGIAWRTGYVSPGQVVRDRLGWATNQEYGVSNAHVQCDSAPKYSRCYLSGPGGIVYVLQPERSAWAVWGP